MTTSLEGFMLSTYKKSKEASRMEERRTKRTAKKARRKETRRVIGRGVVDGSLAVADEATGMLSRLIARAKAARDKNRQKSKVAAKTTLTFTKDAWTNAAKVLGASAAIGATGLVAGTAADKLLGVTAKPIDRAISYKRMMKKNPDLKKLPKQDVKDLFRSLHHFSPYTAADPGVAGGWIRRAVQFKDIGPQASDAKELTSIQANVNKPSSVRAVTDSIFSVRGGDNLLTQTMG